MAKQTYYVTKYALSDKGKIREVEAEADATQEGERYVRLKLFSEALWGDLFTLGKNVFTTIEEAQNAVLAARDKKVTSLRKQIAALEKIGY